MRRQVRFALAFAATIMTAAVASPALAGNIYMAKAGADTNDGSSEAKAVATLATAARIAEARSTASGEAMTILVGPGIYRNQTLQLTGDMTAPLTIAGTSSDKMAYPAFYGSGTGTWLRYAGHSGRSSGLTVRNLRIVGYATAISLDGNRNAANGYNSGTSIVDNIFVRIGTDATKGNGKSTAAIRFVNSRGNTVQGNWFKTIRNTPVSGCGLLHSVYVAHASSSNRITGNTFEDFCGSAIKLRDRSNDNVIENNRFQKSDADAAIDEWYCDQSRNAECTKKTGECPSTGNIARNNRFVDIPYWRQITIRGNRTPRPWCDSADFTAPRVSGSDVTL